MFGKGRHLYHYVLILSVLAFVLPAAADSTHYGQFELKPTSCVVIAKGKNCYGDMVFSWTLQAPRNVCLYQENKERPIFCWSKRETGDFSGAFVLSKTSSYSLVDIESKEVLFTDAIVVTWVYKESQKRRRWRLF
ncbi:signal peptide-containing protein [Alteromonas macleodii str. 'Balearic Sea AD45']|uniref:DUF3019 domain-containing protein n=1 Tax=Alteromonas macleodii TaxID=28108 RepID=UPI000286D06B|nr:DUF3019 domain-containing protein [Alteromonas macleodii]AFT94861.1 signal peptide-containing protein [Alteromonas macleodii str. 'Balearic Sea AD45']